MHDQKDLEDSRIRDWLTKAYEGEARAAMEEQSTILNWLFAANGAGIGGLLTYVAAKEASAGIVRGLVLFFVGLLLVLFCRVVMYWWFLSRHRKLKSDTDKLAAGSLDWSSLVSDLNARSNYNYFALVSAVLSGIAFVSGAAFSAFEIWRVSQTVCQ